LKDAEKVGSTFAMSVKNFKKKNMEAKRMGNNIAEARKSKNMSQAQLAEHLFISAQAVGKWERGESIPDFITMNRLAGILGVDLNYFSEDFSAGVNKNTTTETPTENLEQKAGRIPGKPGWDMSRGNWSGADFSGLKNLHSRFSESNMKNCKFIEAGFAGLLLKNNYIENCNFRDSNFSNSRFLQSFLSGNQFCNCRLTDTECTASFFTGCDFSGADFTGAVIKSGGIEKCKINGSVWNHVSVINSQLTDIIFENTLEDCSFDNCAFLRVTFSNATLRNTFFKCKSLKKIKFVNCLADRMTYEFLKNGKADLSGINMVLE
jgi:uncharacterized protein YjbI with pentapeptide repeats